MMMAVSPDESVAEEKPLDFRAPPPSPIASGRGSSFTNDHVLSEFLQNSVRVPDLVLPDKVFPKQIFVETPPTIDFQALDSSQEKSHIYVMEAVAKMGCFQLVNHGISEELVKQAMDSASGIIFGVPPEKRTAVTRSPEKHYGFEEESEEFVWGENEDFNSEMEGICAPGYSNFREMMERLTEEAERIGEGLVKAMGVKLVEGSANADASGVWYLKKHNNHNNNKDAHDDDDNADERQGSSSYLMMMRNEAIRMLIRGGMDHSHAFSFHILNHCHPASSEFHVYSKRGWLSFVPLSHALLVTLGDQIQTWSRGKYRHVVGRAVYKESDESISISMVYLYSLSSGVDKKKEKKKKSMMIKGRIISLSQQLHFALFLMLVFPFLLFFFNN